LYVKNHDSSYVYDIVIKRKISKIKKYGAFC
jgi:hypothetical protein